ncbi:hypothetical protein PGTUg99_030050 [Puccinia graminis f. sp. tritici]|uniref:Uncharacterized protein n=1 Tax=Puccinia graminis f. sp. tritici TaxID=56615 RepID=A0A5B0SCV9_PUCGR|nr:hypothetical protein PGTUg99_030050 [Puccinia graminis f. sp. tritici]
MLPNEPHGAGGILVMTSNQQSPAQEHSSCELVHHHFQALFGLRPPPGSCAPPRVPPSPPTAAEKKRWLQNHSADHDSGTPMSQSHQKTSKHRSSPGQSSLSASADKDRDPQYPYPEGPGHPDASQEELKIMYNMLRDKHMRRFCMDFTAAMSVPINQFCLTVVQDIFLALLECKEYEGLHPEEQKSEVIFEQLRQRWATTLRYAKGPLSVSVAAQKEALFSVVLACRYRRYAVAPLTGGMFLGSVSASLQPLRCATALLAAKNPLKSPVARRSGHFFVP